MKRFALLLSVYTFLAFTVGCNSTVTQFVKKAKPTDTVKVPTQSNSSNGIKFSPGHLEATSAAVSMQATVTPTDQLMTGGGLSARVGISRNRVK